MGNGYMASKNLNNPKTIQSIIQRLERLEKAIFREKAIQIKSQKASDFKGLKGGIKLLFVQNYFNVKRTAAEVKIKLESHEYRYSNAAIQTTLNRLSGRKGPLVTFKDGGKKYYAKRK